MRFATNRYSRIVLGACLVLAAAAEVGRAGAGQLGNQGVVSPDQQFRGLTYGQWHTLWWQWADSFSNAQSPVTQGDGVVATDNQVGNVWFLAGYFGDWFDETSPAIFTRRITVPSGTALFFPILNGEVTPREWQFAWILENQGAWYEAWSALNPDATLPDAVAALADDGVVVPEPTVEEVSALLASWFADPALVDALHASIDGVPVENLGQYLAPSPEAYVTSLPADDNHMEFYYPDGGEAFPVVADGWCLLVKPLPVGDHTIHFRANFGGTFGMDIKYLVTVAPAHK